MNGNNSKIPTTPPLPLRGTSPKGGSKKSPLKFRLTKTVKMDILYS